MGEKNVCGTCGEKTTYTHESVSKCLEYIRKLLNRDGSNLNELLLKAYNMGEKYATDLTRRETSNFLSAYFGECMNKAAGSSNKDTWLDKAETILDVKDAYARKFNVPLA